MRGCCVDRSVLSPASRRGEVVLELTSDREGPICTDESGARVACGSGEALCTGVAVANPSWAASVVPGFLPREVMRCMVRSNSCAFVHSPCGRGETLGVEGDTAR